MWIFPLPKMLRKTIFKPISKDLPWRQLHASSTREFLLIDWLPQRVILKQEAYECGVRLKFTEKRTFKRKT